MMFLGTVLTRTKYQTHLLMTMRRRKGGGGGGRRRRRRTEGEEEGEEGEKQGKGDDYGMLTCVPVIPRTPTSC